MNITHAQFETLIRRENPEVYTEEQMNSWIESQKEVLIKSEVDELNELEKAAVDEFNSEFPTFVKVTVITSPSDENLFKGLQYTNFYIREKQVEWKEVDIIKSIDGVDEIEKSREGTYTNTAHNMKLGRVGAKFGQHSAKEEEGDSGESNAERAKFRKLAKEGKIRPRDFREMKESWAEEDKKFKDGTKENSDRVKKINEKVRVTEFEDLELEDQAKILKEVFPGGSKKLIDQHLMKPLSSHLPVDQKKIKELMSDYNH